MGRENRKQKRTVLSAAVLVLMWGVMSGAAGVKDLEKAIVAKDEAKAAAILKENPGLANLPKESNAEERRTAPLVTAVQSGNTAMVELLIKNGADVNAPAGEARKTPLMAAARASRPENVKYLLLKGADAAKTDKDGKTALDYAIKGAGKNAKTDETVKVLGEEAAKRKQKGG